MAMLIEEYIPAGYENRVSREYLHEILHIPDRAVRREIELAAERGVLIASCDGGYFRRGSERDDPYIREYMARENNRFKTQSHKNKLMREMWERIHPAAKKSKQIPGQMSLFGGAATNGR